MEITIAGASGFIGSALGRFLETRGHRIRRLVRSNAIPPRDFLWDPAAGKIDPDAIEGADAVINLAGANIAGERWTDARRRLIRDSRVVGTQLLSRAIANASARPKVLVNASGIGFYGTHPEDWVDESSPVGDGFLANVCREWEEATAPVAAAGVRVVRLRMGVVIAPDGGAIAKLLPIFRLGMGGPIGDGRMWLSWISIADLTSIYERVAVDPAFEGPVNAVSPNPCTNKEFAVELGRAMGRPSTVRTPALAVRLALGKMAEETILASARARPARLLQAGFKFAQPTIGEALGELAKP